MNKHSQIAIPVYQFAAYATTRKIAAIVEWNIEITCHLIRWKVYLRLLPCIVISVLEATATAARRRSPLQQLAISSSLVYGDDGWPFLEEDSYCVVQETLFEKQEHQEQLQLQQQVEKEEEQEEEEPQPQLEPLQQIELEEEAPQMEEQSQLQLLQKKRSLRWSPFF
uniref:WIYLD domain-containing protein n=1 Tax=Leersia perrieri TaxID=77586 RepID=A0A0D9XBH6_9ORYZ